MFKRNKATNLVRTHMSQLVDRNTTIGRQQQLTTRSSESFAPDDEHPEVAGTVENQQEVADVHE